MRQIKHCMTEIATIAVIVCSLRVTAIQYSEGEIWVHDLGHRDSGTDDV